MALKKPARTDEGERDEQYHKKRRHSLHVEFAIKRVQNHGGIQKQRHPEGKKQRCYS
ncbi:hypothetical protein [Dyadobacter sp. SG02]|uniref:hypothetical protein n=1 Tax=Dyadobacter sp. SG02 TaxID=1855291 RepID=UPI001C432B2F|nr:hypothetical protein [Dyadobacter sp. SG02]